MTGTEVPHRPSVAATASEAKRNNAQVCHQELMVARETVRAMARAGNVTVRRIIAWWVHVEVELEKDMKPLLATDALPAAVRGWANGT